MGVEFPVPGRNSAVKVHEVLGQSARLVETSKLDHSPSDDLVLRNAEDVLFLQFLNSVDYPEGHAHRQPRRHCDEDEIDERIDDVEDGVVLPVYHHEDDFQNEGDQEKEEQKLGCLPLEGILLFSGE